MSLSAPANVDKSLEPFQCLIYISIIQQYSIFNGKLINLIINTIDRINKISTFHQPQNPEPFWSEVVADRTLTKVQGSPSQESQQVQQMSVSPFGSSTNGTSRMFSFQGKSPEKNPYLFTMGMVHGTSLWVPFGHCQVSRLPWPHDGWVLPTSCHFARRNDSPLFVPPKSNCCSPSLGKNSWRLDRDGLDWMGTGGYDVEQSILLQFAGDNLWYW